MKEEETNATEELELETPAPITNEDDNIAETLTSAELEKTVTKIVDEKIALVQSATDDEEEVPAEDEKDEKGMGLFPALLIGSVVLIGISSLLLKNRPHTSPTSPEVENHG